MELVPIDTSAIALMSTVQLREELARGLQITAVALQRLAMIVHELEARNEDLGGLRLTLLPSLRAIAAGTLLPELVVRFASRPALLQKVALLPIQAQREIADGKKIAVAVDDDTEAELPPEAIPANALHRVFGEDGIRSPLMQRLAIRKPRKKEAPRELKARPDRDNRGIRVGNAFAPLADVLLALADLGGKHSEIVGDGAVVSAKLTEDERNRLRVIVRESGITEQEFIRRALRSLGLI